jgi:hypothetical protein
VFLLPRATSQIHIKTPYLRSYCTTCCNPNGRPGEFPHRQTLKDQAGMEKIVADSLPLSQVLLDTDEEQYDKAATSLVSALSKLSAQQVGSKDALDVRLRLPHDRHQ